jgi:hypothetical protein
MRYIYVQFRRGYVRRKLSRDCRGAIRRQEKSCQERKQELLRERKGDVRRGTVRTEAKSCNERGKVTAGEELSGKRRRAVMREER